MIGPFEFDEKKTAQENVADFLLHVESIDKAFGALLRQNISKMLPLPEAAKRGSVRASFNGEIKKQLDAAIAATRAKHG